MFIKFDPPLGAIVHVTSPSLLPQSQTPLLFTAQLSALDHAQLVRDGGRVQLWSNLSRDGESDKAWREMEYADMSELSARPSHSSAYTRVSLRASPAPKEEDSQTRKLYLPIVLPPTTASTRQFSFTYRIVYPSGDTTWLGAFGKNGSIVIEGPTGSNSLNNLILQGNWSTDSSTKARVFSTEHEVNAMQVAEVINMSDCRIWALGKDRFISNLANAAVLIFVPKTRRSLAALPSYVMAASPGLDLTASTNGRITMSGAGTLQLRMTDVLQEPGLFLEEVLHYSKLDNWSVVASDANNQKVALACTGCGYPIPAAAISLRYSEVAQSSPISVDFSKLVDLFGNSNVKEFAIFSSLKFHMHVFNLEQPQVQKIEKVLLEVDSSNDDFTLSPIYRLRTHNAPNKILRNWGAAILTHYKIVPGPSIPSAVAGLLTPPPSPPSHSLANFSQQIASSPSITSRLSSFPPISPEIDSSIRRRITRDNSEDKLYQEPQQEDRPSSGVNPEDIPLVVAKRPKRAPPRSGLMWVFQCIFASIRTFFKFIFRLIWGPALPSLGPASSTQLVQRDGRLASDDKPSVLINADEHHLTDEEDNDDNGAEGCRVGQPGSGQRGSSSSRVSGQSQAIDATALIHDLAAIPLAEYADAGATSKPYSFHSSGSSTLPESAELVPSKASNTDSDILDSAASRQSESGENVFYAEVSPLCAWAEASSGDDITASKSAMVEIVLLPLAGGAHLSRNQMDAHAGSDTGDDFLHDATTISALSERLEKAVGFLDGSAAKPTAVGNVAARSCRVFDDKEAVEDEYLDRARSMDEEYAASGYILRYLMTWEDLKKGKVFSISAPCLARSD